MFGLLFNLDLSEIAIILIGAIIVFGKNLPQVAMRGAAQFVRLRRQLVAVWREAGFEEELRKAQREIESSVPKLPPPKSFFDAPATSLPAPPASNAPAGAGAGLAAAHELAAQSLDQGTNPQSGPDENPDDRPGWDAEDPYGPSEEERRMAGQAEAGEAASADGPAPDGAPPSTVEAQAPDPKAGGPDASGAQDSGESAS